MEEEFGIWKKPPRNQQLDNNPSQIKKNHFLNESLFISEKSFSTGNGEN